MGVLEFGCKKLPVSRVLKQNHVLPRTGGFAVIGVEIRGLSSIWVQETTGSFIQRQISCGPDLDPQSEKVVVWQKGKMMQTQNCRLKKVS